MTVTVDLRGKACLVTGGSRGIGAATVRALVESGARVFFTYHSGKDEAEAFVRTLGTSAACTRCDLADHAALPAVVDECMNVFGRIDVLVNNAAVFELNRFDGADYDAWRRGWERTFAVNLFGAADLTWLVLQQMRRQRSGRVINVASRAGHRGELEFADYGASKAALINLTKSIARSCARDGITAIAVAPGFVDTAMAAFDMERHGEEVVAEIPIGRIGTPEEIAAFIAFLCSDHAAYANGATIDLNGASYVR
ncbi:MAG TPA: SDR family oxidoreductase [Candidatus Eremiobacteraceae bacterium]|nr:SDR family oxidoreductase [Candidatus Eremiobacteraceae bacterium]